MFTPTELAAYLDEALPSDKMAEVEAELRASPELLEQLSTVNSRRDAGVHSLGDIWRRERLTCPSRQDLGNYLLGIVEEDQADYLAFHIEQVGCRLCQANVADMQSRQADHQAETRRRRYFQSSAGYLRGK